MRKPTFASFFSGCGGLDLGFIGAGWEAVFAVDSDAYSCLTYLHNIGPIWRADVERLNLSFVPDADAWIGGPPCQSWSRAGNGTGSDDPRGRLFPWFAEAVAERRPPLFVIENVRHLLTFPDFYTVVRRLCRAGYRVLWEVVNSRDFRVPQDRKRVFLVGFQRRAAFGFPGGEPGASRSVRDILERDVPDEYLLAEEQHLKIRRLATRIGRSFGEVPLDGVSGTLLASYASNLSWGPYVRVEDAAGRRRSYSDGKPLLRRLTPRECARLQGFPDDFTILGPDAEAYRQLGNAVTVTVAEAVATNLKVVLDA